MIKHFKRSLVKWSMENAKSKLIDLIEDADGRLIRMMLALASEYNKSEKPPVKELYRLVYTSARSPKCDEKDIEEILKASRWNNARLNVTGILIHTKDRFLQVLEGDKDVVMNLYHKIEEDDRHGGSIMRFCEPASQRYFGEWEMAGKAINERTIKFHTDPVDEKHQLYKSMLDGDLTSYKDEGMRVLKTFLMVS